MRISCQAFADPDDFDAVPHHPKAESILWGLGRFTARLAEIEFSSIRLRRTSESILRPAHVQHPPDRVSFDFLADGNLPPVVVDGMEISTEAMCHFGPSPNSKELARGPARWPKISIDAAKLDTMGRNLAEGDLAAWGTSRVVFPDKSAMHRLRGLHAEAVALATQSPHHAR